MKASEFKAKCLQLMDQVASGGELVVITKNGVPVAQLVPVSTRPKTLFGLDAGGIRVLGDIVEPVATAWEAQA
ncbi:MAG: type II toxin-antitoxin system Phd/YefM family antitoxin [Pseudomonadales bacterium]